MPLGQHLCLRLADNRVIAPTPPERRIVAGVILEQGERFELLAFGLADTHPHLLTPGSAEDANELARRVEISLVKRLRLEVGFTRAYVKPILDNTHLNRAFTYVLEQNPHHGLDWDPLHEASNLPDLLGLRELGLYTVANVRRYLPRVTRARLLACLGLEALEPAEEPLEQLRWAAAAALGLPGLDGRSPRTVAARQAVAQVVGDRLSTRELAALLAVSEREVQRMRARPPDLRLLRAIRLQLGLIQRRAAAIERLRAPFLTA